MSFSSAMKIESEDFETYRTMPVICIEVAHSRVQRRTVHVLAAASSPSSPLRRIP